MIFSIVIGVVVFFYVLKLFWKDRDMGWLGLFLLQAPIGGMFGFLIGSLISILIGLGLMELTGYERKEVSSVRITALADNGGIMGTFFIGSGNIKDKMVYTYMQVDNGAMTMHTVDVENANLYEDVTPENAKVIKYQYTLKGALKHFFLLPKSFKDVRHYDIHVPKNSVCTGYRVDLE